jgi:hypothetical protein
MKKYLILIVCSCLLLLTGVAFVACSSDDDGVEQPQVYHVTVEAVLSSDAVTRALSGGGNEDITSQWAQGEVVYVTKSGTNLGTLAPQSVGSASAKLLGTLSVSGAPLAVNDELVLTYLKSSAVYSGQKGTLSDIGANFAIAKATVTITEISGGIVKTGKATFTSQQAIVKFSLKGETNEALKASRLDIKYGSTTLSLTGIPDATYTANGDGVLYVALPAFDSQLLTLTATVGGATYKYEKPAVSFENGKYYPVGVRMGKYDSSYTPQQNYLTLQALNDGTTITFDNKASGIVEYSVNSVNNGSWKTLAGTTTSLNAGDKVYLRGANNTYEDNEGHDSKISCSGPCYVYGNFMSLTNNDSFASATTLTSGSTFCNLFEDNTNIRNHPYKDMVLPATTLTEYCYYGMFRNCTGLSRSPIMEDATASLPEKTKCYDEMFIRCSGLYYVTCYSSPADFSYFGSWLNYVQSKGTLVTKREYESNWNDHKPYDGWTVMVMQQ